MRRRGSGVLVAAIAWVAVAASTAGAAEGKTPPEQTIVQPQQTPPPDLVALEQKMAQMQVNTIRFSGTEAFDFTLGKGGFELPLLLGIEGEVGMSPQEGTFTAGLPGLASVKERLIGNTLYTRQPDVASEDGGRPWVRSEHKQLDEATGTGPVNLGGGSGPGQAFKGVIEEMNSGHSFIEVGPTIVEGQPVMEFTSLLETTKLPNLSAKSLKTFNKLHLTTIELGLFIAPDGLPVRTSITAPGGHSTFSLTVDILAINFPLSVQPPPARKTIGEAQLHKLQRRHERAAIRRLMHLCRRASRKHAHPAQGRTAATAGRHGSVSVGPCPPPPPPPTPPRRAARLPRAAPARARAA